MRLLVPLTILFALMAGCSAEKKAQKAFFAGKYQNSIDMYKKILEKKPNDGKVNYFMAESYRLSNRAKEAEAYYAKAGGRGIDEDTIQLYYGQSLKANSKYAEAQKVFTELANSAKNPLLKDRAISLGKGIEYLALLDQRKNYYRVKNLEALNTASAEYSPVYLNNELYFTSARNSNEKIYEATGTPYTDIYKVSSRGANVEIATLKPLPSGINTQNINDGCVAFSPDGKTMVFAKGNTAKRKGVNVTEDVDLYISRFRSNVWSEPVPININDPEAWDSSPAFSPDGRTLYFASNRVGRGREKSGYGGNDIYSAAMDTR